MIVRQASEADIRLAMANLSPWSAIEYAAASEGDISIIENGLILARDRLFRLFVLCDDAGRPGMMMLMGRGEVGELDLAGFTTTFFAPIKRPFWLWLVRSFVPLLDRHAFRSSVSVMEGHAAWLSVLKRLGFRETGDRPVHGGRVFIDLERLRPSRAVDRRPAGLGCVMSEQTTNGEVG